MRDTEIFARPTTSPRGGKHAVVLGLTVAAAAGVFYVVSLRFVGTPFLSLAILLAGRPVLGAVESFIVTGALTCQPEPRRAARSLIQTSATCPRS